MIDSLRKEILDALATMPHGWCTPDKALAMADLILAVQPETVVEIGVFAGRSIIPQALALRHIKRGIIYGIDPWRREDTVEGNLPPIDKDWWSKVDLEDIHRICMETIWRLGLTEHCIIIRSASQYCPKLFAGGIDILHVDGSHSTEASVRDVHLYLPQVSQGNHVWFDDASWATTKEAVTLLEKSCGIVDKIGDCTLFRKR